MADRRYEALLQLINTESPDGSYKILDAAVIAARLPKKHPLEGAELAKAMEYLSEEELVVVKYADGASYCVASTPRGRLFSEKKTEEQRKAGTQKRLMLACLVTSAIGAFVGALVAILVMLPLIR